MATAVEKVTLRLRDMIMSGEFQPGERISEMTVAQSLGVSRTPVRWALSVLETEGLVTGAPNRGFRTKSFSVEDVLSAYEVRGALEGLACRLAAEKGLSAEVEAEFDACLAEGEALLRDDKLDEHTVKRWSAMNERFHQALLTAAVCPALEPAYAAVSRYPAAGPGAIMFLSNNLRASYNSMRRAHEEHSVIVAALKAGQSTRAEYLIREHVYNSSANVKGSLERERARAAERQAPAAEASATPQTKSRASRTVRTASRS